MPEKIKNPSKQVYKEEAKGADLSYSIKDDLAVVEEKSFPLQKIKLNSITKMPGKETNRFDVRNDKDRDTVGLLEGIANKPESNMTPFEKMEMVRTGISKSNLENLKQIAALDYDELAKALSVTRATLINKKGNDKFSATLSERIVALADIYSYGYSVFEDEERFNKWMFRPNQALAGKAPYEMVDNQFGREEVRNIIGRIDYGVYS